LTRFTISLYSMLERAYRQRVPHLVFLAVGAEMDTLRQEKRFRELLMRIGLGNR
jgi:hypothetical protein